MRHPALLTGLSLAVLLFANAQAQDQVQIQFQTDPVLVQTGTDVLFTVLTVSEILTMTWKYKGDTLGLWTTTGPVINPVPQFVGRMTITATQLRIGSAQLRDAGNYTVEVTPSITTGLDPNSRSIQLRVFDAVAGVSLFVPSVAVEAGNVSLRCTWTAGTEITVQWGKGGAAITADSRITITGGSLVINPARRGDAGEYSCTASNPVSAQTATQSLTVYYGPDAPVLTKDAQKDCVGAGDVMVGQTVRLTCMSDSLPPALFSWQRDGQPVASGQPDSGVLSLQTFSTDESGRYVCTARNSITGGTSEQGTVLTIVDTCLNGGEVAGIVIGCFLLIVIIVLLILLIVFLIRRRRAQERQRNTVFVPKTNPNPRPIPPDPQPNGAGDLGQGPNPPLYHSNTRARHPDRLYAALPENRSNTQPPPLNARHNSDTRRHNGHTDTNRLLHSSIQNANSDPHNGIDNPAFTHADAQNVNTLPNIQPQNPNILIQAGAAQGGAQPPAVHVSLNAQTPQQNGNAQMPTIHVNLNSYPSNGQQTLHDANAANNNTLQSQQTLPHAAQSNPSMQSGPSNRSDPWLNGHVEAGHQDQRGLVPTGYSHYNSNNTSLRNANTQTYQQELQPQSRSERDSGRRDTTARSTPRQMPWDRLRGTPAYPSGTLQRGQTLPDVLSDTTDYTSQPPTREARAPNRSQPRPQSQTTSRSRAAAGEDTRSADRQTRSGSADPLGSNTRGVVQLEAAHPTQRSPRTQRERAQRDIRNAPGSQNAPRQEARHSNTPQARPLMSQQASVGHSAVSQGLVTQQGPAALQGADTRALADPNHLPQTHVAQQHRAAPIQNPPAALGAQTQPVAHSASQPRQGGAAPVPHSSAQPNPSNLTQATLKAHTERAKTFQNRKQQTQAALLHPGPQARAPAAGAQHPPTPPPVIPLTQFQTLPKKGTHHKSPARGPQPPRPPVNVPVAQRPPQAQQRPTVQHHPAAKHHHHPGNGHTHGTAHRHAHAHARGHGHGHPAHFVHPQQAHRGRPR